MCRYSFVNYKVTYGCFKCQVGFKRPLLQDVMGKKLRLEQVAKKNAFTSKDFRCPNCGGVMANLGRDLRLPSKTKTEQWRCIKYLYDNKYNIYSCGCQGIGFVPHKMEDAITLVASVKTNEEINKKIERQKEKDKLLQASRKKKANALRTIKLLRVVKKEEKNN
jgi:hypothetical protein